MDRFDLFTILILHALVTLIFAIFLFNMKKNLNKKFKGLFHMMLGFLLYAVGTLLLSLREFLPYELYTSILFGNYIIFSSMIILNLGIKRLFGIIEENRSYLIISILFLFVFAYLTLIDNNVSLRIVVISMSLFFVYGQSAVYLYKKAKKFKLDYLYSLVYMLVGYIIINFSRAVAAIINYHLILDFLSYSQDVTFHVLGLLLLFSIFINITFIINKILSKELENKLDENEILISTLEELTKVDFLTGLLNRKSLEEKAHDLIEKCSENHHTFTYILMDLNDFKEINDIYGHPFGDQILINFGQMIQNYSNYVYRYGGDEFVMILEDSSHDAEKLMQEMSSNCSLDVTENNHIPCFSYGIHVWKEGQCYADMMREADQMMYRQKRVES
ncbi:MAG: GGDEF domain-containing protein [Acholeplasmataceae bacterium]|nr:GGDEF domain-containing protein [Acholeplasmataceae bacterium]